MQGNTNNDQNTPITIIVNQEPHKIDSNVIDDDAIRQLAGAPDDYEVWKVIKNPDAEGQLPVDDIQITSEITVKSGDRFRVVPPGTFGARLK